MQLFRLRGRTAAGVLAALVMALAVGGPGAGWGPSSALAAEMTSVPADQGEVSPSGDGQSPQPLARVGIQAGHWLSSALPAELASLRGATGAAGNGWREVDVNLDIARRVEALLGKAGVQVDLLPATVPPDYGADAFVALHGDANGTSSLSGYKLARASWSSIPEKDDALLKAISAEYQAGTGLVDHPQTITQNMTMYYAFNHRLEHSVSPATPSVILEMGFLTNAQDRDLLMQQPDRVAEAITKGILRFLGIG